MVQAAPNYDRFPLRCVLLRSEAAAVRLFCSDAFTLKVRSGCISCWLALWCLTQLFCARPRIPGRNSKEKTQRAWRHTGRERLSGRYLHVKRPKSLGSSSGLEWTHSPLEAVVERGDLFWSLFWISDFWHCYPVAQTSRRSSLGKWQLLITVGSSRVLEGPLVHLVSVETHVGTAERSRRSSWCTSEKSIECFFWTSAAVREYFHRERTPQRKVRASSSSLCLDYVDEGVPHLHASHSGGGRGSFIDFCEPQSCRSASFACFALLHLFYCKSDRRSISGKFTIFCTKASYKQELESGSHRGVELLFVSPSTQLVCVQQQQRESCD